MPRLVLSVLLVVLVAHQNACGSGDDATRTGTPSADSSDGAVQPVPDAEGDGTVSDCGGVVDGVACDDGNACTQGDRCLGGACVGTENLQCEDVDSCKVGRCDPAIGCVVEELDGGEACGSLCAGAGACRGGECEVTPGTEVVCDPPTSPCVMAVLCEPTTGQCTRGVPMPEGAGCDADANDCTIEFCDGAGACEATGEVDVCADEVVANPCWSYVCEPTKGCRKGTLLLGLSCNDNNPCTVNDECVDTLSGGGACEGTALEVDDGNVCTDDYCDGGTVRHAPVNGVSCDPDAVCDVAGECVAGSCVATRACVCPGDAGCPPPVCTVPCANGGACVADDTCDCGSTGYTGPTCSTPACDPPCANGTCTAPDTCDCGSTGYTGPTCSTPVCEPPCANGSCTAPDTCTCGSTGYTGPTCSTPVCDPPCANGTCTAPDTCDCGTSGYTGPTCSTPVCDPPCANGSCTAPDTCSCGDTGYTGPNCSTPVCDPACDQGACTAPDVCTCDLGYEGPLCSNPVCDPPCDQGSCIAPDMCDCDPGYEGDMCSTPVCDPECEQGACTAPDTCTCPSGYTDPLCSTPVCDPPCDHGSCIAPDACECDPGYTGATCSTPVCNPPCDQGACTAPDTCTCDEGYEDDLCSTPICDPACDQGSCIAPDLCDCDPGYEDDLCSTPVCDPPCDQGTCTAPDVCECDPGYTGPTCSTPDTVSWIRTFGTAGQDYGGQSSMLSRSHDGHYLVVGGTTSTDSDGDAYLIKVDGEGDLLDTRTYGGTNSDSFSGITRFGSGYAACGSSLSFGGSRSRGYCVTLGADLASTSANAYGGNDVTNIFDLTPSSATTLITAGNSTDTDAFLDIVARKHDAAGLELWKKYFPRSRDDTALNVLAFDDGSYLLSGFTGGWSNCQQYYAIRIDDAGTKIWDRTYGTCSANNQVSWHQMRQAIETADNGFIATGSTVIGGVRSVFLQKFAADGTSVWIQTYGGTGNEYGTGLVATSDGGFAIVGWTDSFGAGGDDVYLIKTTGDGTLVWQRTFGGAANDQGVSILQMADGGFLIGGTTSSWGAGGADLLVIRTDADGNAPPYVQCTPACQNGGTCVATDECDCTGTNHFGDLCQYSDAEYTTGWTKDTEPRVIALNEAKTIGTISWKYLVGASTYRITRYNGANFARELVTSTTARTYDASVSYSYRVEALRPDNTVLDFVNVGIQTTVAHAWTTGTFVDNFDDNTLAPNYLSLKPHQVSEASGYLQITVTVTDDYPAFYLPYDTQGKRYLKLTARLFQNKTNNQYTGGIFFFPVENSWKFLFFGSPWEDYRAWRGGLFRYANYRGNPPSEDVYPVILLDSVSRFGSWFDYQVTIDTQTGVVSGSLGGETFPTHFPMQTQFLPTGKVLIHFTSYGWFTGHYLRIDDLRVESYD